MFLFRPSLQSCTTVPWRVYQYPQWLARRPRVCHPVWVLPWFQHLPLRGVVEFRLRSPLCKMEMTTVHVLTWHMFCIWIATLHTTFDCIMLCKPIANMQIMKRACKKIQASDRKSLVWLLITSRPFANHCGSHPTLEVKKNWEQFFPSSPRLCAMDTSIACTCQRFHAWLENVQSGQLPFHIGHCFFTTKCTRWARLKKKCRTSGADKARAIVLKLEILGSKSAISILRGRHDLNGWWDFPARGESTATSHLSDPTLVVRTFATFAVPINKSPAQSPGCRWSRPQNHLLWWYHHLSVGAGDLERIASISWDVKSSNFSSKIKNCII